MSKLSPTVDRQVRIELLRARAAVEREALLHNVAGVAESLSPSRLIRGLMPRMSAGNMPVLAWQAFSMVRRYPVIMSTLSAVFLRGKRSRLLKLATAAAVGWQAYRGWKARRPMDEASRPDQAVFTSPVRATSTSPGHTSTGPVHATSTSPVRPTSHLPSV